MEFIKGIGKRIFTFVVKPSIGYSIGIFVILGAISLVIDMSLGDNPTASKIANAIAYYNVFQFGINALFSFHRNFGYHIWRMYKFCINTEEFADAGGRLHYGTPWLFFRYFVLGTVIFFGLLITIITSLIYFRPISTTEYRVCEYVYEVGDEIITRDDLFKAGRHTIESIRVSEENPDDPLYYVYVCTDGTEHDGIYDIKGKVKPMKWYMPFDSIWTGIVHMFKIVTSRPLV